MIQHCLTYGVRDRQERGGAFDLAHPGWRGLDLNTDGTVEEVLAPPLLVHQSAKTTMFNMRSIKGGGPQAGSLSLSLLGLKRRLRPHISTLFLKGHSFRRRVEK